MQRSKIKKIILNSFWLSVFLHLLILIYIFFIMPSPIPVETKPLLQHHYVPAYTYTGSIKPSHPTQQADKSVKNTSKMKTQQLTQEKNLSEQTQKIDNHPSMVHLPKVLKKMPPTKTKLSSASLLADSFNMMREDQMREVTKTEESDPMYLIGDDSQPADPLIKLIGQALSKNFRYPRVAGELGIQGRVVVKLTLTPQGYFSNVQMIKSSNNQDLDAAALYAINAAPKIYGADRFISQPKRMVIGFVFEQK